MATKLIKLEDNILVEVEVSEEEATRIAHKLADQVNSSISAIKPILITLCRPIAEAWEEINKNMHVEQAEVEIGFGFEAEGNIYITKAKTETNLTIKFTLKPDDTRK
jgi:hypothetical protein